MHGLRVGVTGARKAAQLAGALERRGAETVTGPLVTTDVPVDDATLLDQTRAVLELAPPWFAASTGVGMRLWAEVAARHGLGDEVRRLLEAATCVARGAKAVGGLGAFGVRPAFVTEEETDAAVAGWLAERVPPGDGVGVQLHGGEADDDGLGDYGDLDARVAAVRPYRAGLPPEDEDRARELIRRVCDGELDVVTFTSPGAARNLFALARRMGEDTAGRLERVLGREVAVAAIGAVTGEVFAEAGVPVAIMPERHRQGDLVDAVEQWAARSPA